MVDTEIKYYLPNICEVLEVWEEVKDVEDDDENYWDAVGRKTQRVAEHPLVGTLSGQIAHILI